MKDDKPKGRVPLTPSFLIATAGAFLGVDELGGNNRGQMVERFLRFTGLGPGHPWCAAFVSYVGYWSHYDHWVHTTSWPLAPTASCWHLGQDARSKGVLVTAPEEGDVFLQFDPLQGRFSHTGIVVRVLRTTLRPSGSTWYECITIDGNTNAEGSREGDTVAERRREFYPDAGDRFIRWVALDRRDKAGKAA